MSVDLSQFHQVFFEESFENLDAMETHLMEIDPSNLETETINSIFRAAHSIKGGSATFSFTAVAEFTHLVETLLDQLRAGERETSREEVDLYLASVDCLRDLLQAYQQGEEPDTDRPNELSQSFEKLLSLEPSASSTNSEESAETSETAAIEQVWKITFKPGPELLTSGNEPIRMFRVLAEMGELKITVHQDELPNFESLNPEICNLRWELELVGNANQESIDEVFEWVTEEAEINVVQEKCSVSSANSSEWSINFTPSPGMLVTGNDPVKIFRDIADLGLATIELDSERLPAFESYTPDECYLSWHIKLASDCSREDIDKVFEWVEDEAEIEIKAPAAKPKLTAVKTETVAETPKAIASKGQAKPAAKPSTKTEKKAGGQSGAKVESSSIRVAIDKIDNLINMVGELVITQSMLGQIGGDFSTDKLPRLREGLGQLEHNTRELQESVMRIRMLPISFAFSRFPRMVRDLGTRLDKQINLVLQGEQTELDKTVMERIGDPLVHLVRNSVDHGIETKEERSQTSKPAEGTITLNAYHQSGNVVIEVIDDGRGINREKLLNKAIKQGLLSETDAASISDGQAFDYIFHPGLSTAAEISDVSGRGVGMDVVKRNIQELNGTIDIRSKEGVGTTITIRLPLTLAILDGQLVRVGNNIYIFPLVSIVESMQIKQDDLSVVAGGCEVFQLRDEYLPVVRLYDIFSVKPDSFDIEDSLLVVVEADGEKIGVVVDELSSQQQVVIKSLEQNYQRVEGISGATILGDGTVSLIIDIPGLVTIAGLKHLTAHGASRKLKPTQNACV